MTKTIWKFPLAITDEQMVEDRFAKALKERREARADSYQAARSKQGVHGMKSPMVESSEFVTNKGGYTDLQVLRSNAGYYIGTLYKDGNGLTEPGSRDSDYFKTRAEATRALGAMQASGKEFAQTVLRNHPADITQAERDAGRARVKANPRADQQAAQRASQAARPVLLMGAR